MMKHLFIHVLCSIAVNKIIDITGFLSSPNSNSIYEALTELNVFLNKWYTKFTRQEYFPRVIPLMHK